MNSLVDATNRPDDVLTPRTPTGKHSAQPHLNVEPPTPEASIDGHSTRGRSASPTLSPEEAAKAVARGAQSGPATPSGTRENQPLNWKDDVNGDAVYGKQDGVDARSLSSSLLLKREQGPSPSILDRHPSPLRHSIIEKVEDDDGDFELDDEQIIPSVETDRALE